MKYFINESEYFHEFQLPSSIIQDSYMRRNEEKMRSARDTLAYAVWSIATSRDLRHSFNEPLLLRPIPNPRCPSFGDKINLLTSNKIAKSRERPPQVSSNRKQERFFSFCSGDFSLQSPRHVSEKREMANRSGSRDRGVALLASRWLNGERKLEKRVSFTMPNPKVLLDVRENDSSPPR